MSIHREICALSAFSTDAQGADGYGIEAQREAINRHLNGGDWELLEEFVEVESGKDHVGGLFHKDSLRARARRDSDRCQDRPHDQIDARSARYLRRQLQNNLLRYSEHGQPIDQSPDLKRDGVDSAV